MRRIYHRKPAAAGFHLIIPDLSQGTFLGVSGRTLLMGGLGICALGLLFGLITYMQLRDLPVCLHAESLGADFENV